MAIKTLGDYVKENKIDMNRKYTTQELQDITWTKKQKQNLTRYQPKKKEEKGNFIVRTVATVDDALINMSKGFLRRAEGWADKASYLIADVEDFFGADEWAERTREQTKRNLVDELYGNSKTVKAIKSEAYQNKYVTMVEEGVGDVLASMGGSHAIGLDAPGVSKGEKFIKSSLLTYESASGNAMSEALRNGADLDTARKAGVVNGISEAISEQFFDGLPIARSAGWGDNVIGKIGSSVEKYFGSKTGKLAMKALKASGEGFEEIISNMLTSAGTDVMHYIDRNYTYGMENQTGNIFKDTWKAMTSKESWDSFITATLTSAITNSGQTLISNTQKNNIIKSYAQENNMSVKQVKDMFNQTVQERTEYQKQQQPKMNLGEQVELAQHNKIRTLEELQKGTYVQPGTETQKYQYKETDNQKLNEMNKSLAEVANNTQLTRETAKTAERLVKDLGFNIKFTNNEQIQNQIKNGEIKAVDGTNINGYVKNGTMYINVDSDQLANFTIGHETKHFFEANEELNNALNQSLKEYAQQKGVWEKMLAERTDLYTDKDGNLVGDPEGELLADLSGQFFTDYNFVNNLSTKNPSLFQKTKDFFQKLYYKATGQQEKLLLKQINENFNKVYREYAKNKPDTNISSNEIQKVSQKEETKQEIKKKVKPKEEIVLPIAEKTEEKQEVVKKQEKKVEVKEKPQVKQENRLTKEEQTELDGLQAAEEAFGNEGQDKVRYDYLMDKKNGNLKYPSLKSETTYQDIKNKYTKYKNNMEEFNSDLIQQAKDFVPGYRNTERRTKQQWLDVAEMIGKRANFKTDAELEKYAIQSWFKEQPNQKGNLNRQGEKFVKFTIEDWINSVYKGAGVGERIDNSIKYSLSVKDANTTQDNEGRKLSKEQKEYFADSMVIDENGNLITVYHTTTDEIPQFNEFNPVGTQYYRFGDQVVNYYTNSKDMSGSYASQDYEMADTKKLNNIQDAEDYLKTISEKTGNEYNISKHNTMLGVTQDKQISKEARQFIDNLTENEKQQMLDNIWEEPDDSPLKGSNYDRVFSWNNFDKELQKKFHELTDKYIGTADTVAIQQEVMKYLESPVLLNEDNRLNGEVVGIYENEEELLKNLKSDLQKQDWSKNTKLQYEGYVNITNPYVIDAEQRNWNQVIQQSNEFIDELEERVPQDIKNNLTRLYQESANKSAEARDNYNVLENVISQGINGYLSSVDENIKKVNDVVKEVGFSEIEQMLKGESPGVSAWYNIADSLERNGLIGSATKTFIIDEFRLPEQVKNLIEENYTKEIPMHHIQTDDIKKIMDVLGTKTATLKDIYNTNKKNYDIFEKYRYPNSYFLEQISAEGNDYLGNELNDMFETRTEINGAEQVGEEIAQAASVAFSKPELIRLWGTSKTTNDVVKEIIASNKDGLTNYDGVIIKNVYDYGGRSATETQANDLYVTFNSNQFKAVDNENPTEDADIRYSLSQKEDTDFDELSEKQIEYFKNTKAVDKQGYLETVYHGTPEDFNIFDIEKAGKTGVEFGNGFYFTNSKGTAMAFTEGGLYGDSYDQVKEGYINIEKPASRNSKTISFDEFKKLYNELNNNKNLYDEEMGMSNIDALLSDYGDIYNDKENTIKKFYDSYDNDVTLIDNLSYMANPKEMYEILRNVTGIDGIIIENPTNYDSYEKYYVAFNPDQFKLKSNKTPTINEDMRYSLSREGQNISEELDEFYTPKNKVTTRLSDLKRKEVELPIAEEKPLKLSKNEQKQANEIKEEYLPLVKDNEVLRVDAENIAKEINKTGDFDTTKQRKWIQSLKNSDAIQDKGFLKDLNMDKLSYEVQTNKKSLDRANDYIENNGYENSLNHVKDLIRSEKTPTATDVALLQRMTQEAIKNKDYQTAQELIMDTAILGTDLGQAVQAMSIIQKLTPEGQLKLYTKMINRAKIRGEKAFTDVEITPDMVETVLGAYNEDGTYDQNDLTARVEKFKQDIATQMKSTIGDKVNAWRYLSMLGNPKTHIRNVVSNVAMKGTIKVKNTLARTLETVLPVKERTKTFEKASKDIKNYAKETAAEMKGIITGENKYNEKVALEQEKQIFKNKALEGISRFNSAALEAEDWFFSRSAFESNLSEYLTANGVKSMEDIKNNPEIVEKAKIYAVEQAEIATFRQYSKLAAEISRIERNGKLSKYAINAVLPFKKTPINVAKAGFNYSPLGLIKNISYDAYQLKQGNINGSQFIDNISQGLTGTSVALLGYALAKAGILSGGGDDDKEGKYDSQLGKQSYALNIGGKTYSISWLSPTGMPLLVGANLYEKLEEDKDWSFDVVADTLANTLDPMSEMSFLSSLTDVLKSYNTGGTQMIKSMTEAGAQSYILQFFPTLFGQLASTLDDTKRSTKASNNSNWKFGEETIRKIMLKVPGLRNQLEEQTDIWGNAKQQTDNIITRAVESFIAPYSKTEDITSDLDKEIKRVFNKTGETSVIPGIPQAYVKKDDETFKMSASEYTQYKKTFGQTANSTLNELVNSSSYKNADDEDKVKMIENVYKYAREQAKQEYFNSIKEDYNAKETSKVEKIQEDYGITAGDYYANKDEYSYAEKNPDKYLTISQVGNYKDYNEYKSEINRIKQEYDNTNDRKNAVFEYINSLPLNVEQKLILQKTAANYSVKQYRGRLQDYIESLDLSADEKQAIDKVLFD